MKTNRTTKNVKPALKKLVARAKSAGWKTIALYGAGKHTLCLLGALGKMKAIPFKVNGIVDDAKGGGELNGIPIWKPEDIGGHTVDALVISSDAFENALYLKALDLNFNQSIVRLYEDTPSSSVEINRLLARIISLPSDWHKAGTVMGRVLNTIVRLTGDREIERSVETGSGKTTLLFSNISKKHTVFALDGGNNSITAVRTSPFFRPERVEWVEGPTQLTMPRYSFTDPIQFALIDGPHGYPFPEMEYYYIYPHLAEGALLVLDDIHIPTLKHMFEFLKKDAMFELVEVVMTTAFFRRTSAPTFSPTGDGWWLQGFNRTYFPAKDHPELAEWLRSK